MREKLLTICIPTYNRDKKAIEQIKFVTSEIEEVKEYVDIIVGDNSKVDKISSEIQEYIDNKLVCYIKNEGNIGFGGNLKKLCNKACSKYIWYLGDDDYLNKGIIKIVVNSLLSNEVGSLFINHSCYLNDKVLNEEVYTGELNGVVKNLNDKKEVFKEVQTGMMFISAVIIKKIYYERILENINIDNLALPLGAILYALVKEPIYILREVGIKNIWGDISWSEKEVEVFSVQIMENFNVLINKLNVKEVNEFKNLYVRYGVFKGYFKAYAKKHFFKSIKIVLKNRIFFELLKK